MISKIKTILLLALSAVLLSLAHPSSLPIIAKTENLILNTGWQEALAWFGLLPMLFAMEKLRGWKTFLAAAFFAFVYFGLSLYWINNAIVIYGFIPLPFALMIYSMLIIVESLMWSLMIFWAYFTHRRLGISLSFTLPVFFVGCELSRNYLFSGFPWQNLAYSQYLNLPILQTASIWGIYGILFMLILCNTVLYELFRWWSSKRPELFPKNAFVLLVALLGFSFSYGVWRLHANDEAEASSEKIKVAMVQGNIDQTVKNQSLANARRILNVYKQLTMQIPNDVELVIWPEAAMPYNIPSDYKSLERVFIDNFPEVAPWTILLGVPTFKEVGDNRHFYNSAFVLDRLYRIKDRFSKTHLVPFGEYVPLGELLGLEKIPFAGMFKPGELGDGMGYGNRRFGVLICYEGIFPEISYEYARKNVDFLVNLTNDAWYAVSSAPYQHLAFYSFRAVETRKNLLRAANTGFTATIDSSGRIKESTSLFERTILFTEISVLHDRTMYSKIGDIPPWTCFVIMVIWMVRSLRRDRKRNFA